MHVLLYKEYRKPHYNSLYVCTLCLLNVNMKTTQPPLPQPPLPCSCTRAQSGKRLTTSNYMYHVSTAMSDAPLSKTCSKGLKQSTSYTCNYNTAIYTRQLQSMHAVKVDSYQLVEESNKMMVQLQCSRIK